MSTDKVFDGDQNSPQYVLFLADEVMSKTTFNGTTARFIYLARRLAERLIDFEDDFKKTVAGTCAPDEKHCSCVPHLRRAYFELSNEPRWSATIPTAPGHYWFYGTSEAERRSPYGRSLKSRLCQFILAGEEKKYLAAICDGNFIYPTSEGYVGKWLKFTLPTPEVDNENG